MDERRRFFWLTGILALTSMLVTWAAVWVTYTIHLDQERTQLRDIVESRARILESVASFDREHSEDSGEGTFAGTLSKFMSAHRHFPQFRETGQWQLARRANGRVAFLLSSAHGAGPAVPETLLEGDIGAEMFCRALDGEGGVDILTNAHGESVLAAYEPVAVLNLGAVLTVNMAEIRAPFVRGGLLGSCVTALLVLLATALSRRLSEPIVRQLKDNAAKLAESEALHRDAFEHVGVGLAHVGLQRRFIRVNPQFCKILGYSEAELLAKRFLEITHPDDRAKSLALGRSVTSRPANRPYTIEKRYVRKDGSTVWASLTVRMVCTPEGDPDHVVAMIEDITARRRIQTLRDDLERKLASARQLEVVGQLAGGVAHDFNNMLCVITGYAELGRDLLPVEHPVARNLRMILEAGKRSAALTRQLLAFGRKQVLAPKTTDLNQIVSGTRSILSRLIGEDIELRCVLCDSPAYVHVDPNQMSQVILNLAINARDAMPQGGRLELRTEIVQLDEGELAALSQLKPGPHVRLTLTDTGAGMSQETLSHVFEPFFTTKEIDKGTGLGLASAHGFVSQSGGTITATSELGEGSAFTIHLPQARHTAPAATDEHPHRTEAGGSETILLVEDEELVRRMLQEALSLAGYDVLVAEDGESAIRYSTHRSNRIDLLLTDVVMPRLSGVEVADALREQRPDMRVIYMSGYPGSALERHGVDNHAFPLLIKPLEIPLLLAKIREALDEPAPVGA